MSTDIDGAALSVTPDPGDDPDTAEPGWLQQEIRRRAAQAGSSGGRHARRGGTEPPSTAHSYVPRHGRGAPVSAAPAVPVPARRVPGAGPPSPQDDPWSRPAPGWSGPGATPRPIPGPASPSRPAIGGSGSTAPAHPAAGAPTAFRFPRPSPPGDITTPPTEPLKLTRPAPPASAPTVTDAGPRIAAPRPAVERPAVERPAVVRPPAEGSPPEGSPPKDSAPRESPPDADAGPPAAAGSAAPTVPRTSETLPGLPHLTPVSDPAIAGSRPGMPAVTPRSSPKPGPAAATLGALGAPSRPDDLTARKRPRPDPPSGASVARLLGLSDEPPPHPRDMEAVGDPRGSLDVIDAPDLDDDDLDDVGGGLLEEDLGAEEGDRILWSAGPSAPASVPEQRTSEAVREDDTEEPGAPRGARFPRLDDGGPQRVRVVLSERKGVARPVRNVVELQESGAVGDLLRSNLIRSQLGVALRFALGGGLVLGALPLLFTLFPQIGRFEVIGFRVPWLLLGVAVYPFLFGLGWWFTRVAERVEQYFADQVQD